MFLTVTTTGGEAGPATDLGFLLHKHPDRVQAFSTSHGTAHVFYPQVTDEVCTAALLLEVDPVALVRRGRGKGRGGAPDSALAQYVNDRPYAASSLLATAIGGVFSSAMKGVSRDRSDRAAAVLPLRIALPAVPARGGVKLTRALFEPMGWAVTAEPVALDEQFPEWGESRYVTLTLEGELRLADALRHLCRGREYLRIIYGPEYTAPATLERPRSRSLGHKRSLALREYALGLEALDRLAAGEPLWRVHEAVFAVLALESEPVDPRL